MDLCEETPNGCGLRGTEPRDRSQFGTQATSRGDLSQLGDSGNAPVRTTSAAMSCSLRLLCWLLRFSA